MTTTFLMTTSARRNNNDDRSFVRLEPRYVVMTLILLYSKFLLGSFFHEPIVVQRRDGDVIVNGSSVHRFYIDAD